MRVMESVAPEVEGGGLVIGRSVAGPSPSDSVCVGVGSGREDGSSSLVSVGGDGGEVGDGGVTCSAPAVMSCCSFASSAADALRSLISTGDDDGFVSCIFGCCAEDIAGASVPEEAAIVDCLLICLFDDTAPACSPPRHSVLVLMSAAKVQLLLPML